jgi:alkylation response protein AidB-like acyl-CoA dehydrogenase
MFRKAIRDFAEKEIVPKAEEIDKEHRFPEEIFRKMGELGFLGLPIPEKYGGVGADTLSYAIAVEEVSRACGSTGITFVAQTSLACGPLLFFGSEEQKRKYLTPLATGEWIGSFGLTEPEAGSDAGATRTRAVRDGDEWVINGRKIFITNGSLADVIILTAKTDPEAGTRGITNFIVEKGNPGFKPWRDEDKFGLRGSITSEIVFEDCRVPDENVLGKPGEGFKQFLVVLDAGRISIGAMALGLAQAAFDRATEYAKTRVQFGRPIAKFQAIQWMLADMATEIDAARLLVYRAAWLKDHPVGPGRGGKGSITREAAMAKLFASEVAERAAFKALQIHGGYGYTTEYDVERIYRDQRLCTIGEGTSEIQRLVIAREVLGEF